MNWSIIVELFTLLPHLFCNGPSITGVFLSSEIHDRKLASRFILGVFGVSIVFGIRVECLAVVTTWIEKELYNLLLASKNVNQTFLCISISFCKVHISQTADFANCRFCFVSQTTVSGIACALHVLACHR